MKLTTERLKKLIKEQLADLNEMDEASEDKKRPYTKFIRVLLPLLAEKRGKLDNMSNHELLSLCKSIEAHMKYKGVID
tara:strand:+ start:3971 stop:4204 length:234 start_codon:yes stop_codon:yes gene_type:complete